MPVAMFDDESDSRCLLAWFKKRTLVLVSGRYLGVHPICSTKIAGSIILLWMVVLLSKEEPDMLYPMFGRFSTLNCIVEADGGWRPGILPGMIPDWSES